MSPTGRDTAWVGREFDQRADTYDHSAMHHWQAELAAAALHPTTSEAILDVATGTGLAARACASITGSPHRIVGIDVSHRMLRAAAQVSTSTYIQSDATHLPFAPGSFDAVLCVSSLTYLPDLTAAVTEWRRVARPGATLVFTTPAADGVTVLRLIRQAAAQHHLHIPDPHASLTAEVITQVAATLRLQIDRIERHSFPEQLGPDAQAAYDTVLNYGTADQLATAPSQVRDRVFDTYQQAYNAARGAGTAEHAVMLTRSRFRNDTTYTGPT